MARTAVILLIFCLFGWFLFTYKLTDVPPGINGDELAIGYLSSVIAKNGYDVNGKFLPLFTGLTVPDWKQPVTIYSTVATFKLFGASFFNLRAVSVIFSLISGIIIYFLAKEIFDESVAIISLVIFITIPIILIQSHLAMENIAPVPFVAFWLLMIAKYSKNKKNIYLSLAAISLGLSVYSYLGFRLIVPVLIIASSFFILYLNSKKKIYPLGIFILTLLPFFILMLFIKDQYPAAILASNRPQQITSYQDFLLPFISSFDLSFLFIKGDSTPYHSTGKQGMFLLATLPLFLLGILRIAKGKNPFLIFILIVFLLSPLLYGLPGSMYRSSRLMALIPPFIIITLVGIKGLMEIKKRHIKYILVSVFFLLLLLNYTDSAFDYWFKYPNRVKQNFEKPIHVVFEKAATLSKKDKLQVFIEEDILTWRPPTFNFFENVYFPNGLKKWNDRQSLDAKSITIVSIPTYRMIPNSRELEVYEYEDTSLVLLVNPTNNDQ